MGWTGRAGFASLVALALLASCKVVPPGERPGVAPPPTPPTAALVGVRAGPAIDSLALGQADAAGALASFVESCPRLLVRTDASGLTAPENWQAACTGA